MGQFSVFTDHSRYHRSGVIFACGPNIPENLATSLPADRIDWLERTITGLGQDQRWVDQAYSKMIDDLKMISFENAPFTCRLIENFDIVLSRWTRQQLDEFWLTFARLARNAPHPVILLLPTSAEYLGPQGPERVQLEAEKRLIVL